MTPISAIRDVLLSSDALHAARPGLVHVVTSTISVGFADELGVRHAETGIGYVAAPVFGRPEAAEAAQLEVMVAGEKGAVGKCARCSMSSAGGHGCWAKTPSKPTRPSSPAT